MDEVKVLLLSSDVERLVSDAESAVAPMVPVTIKGAWGAEFAVVSAERVRTDVWWGRLFSLCLVGTYTLGFVSLGISSGRVSSLSAPPPPPPRVPTSSDDGELAYSIPDEVIWTLVAAIPASIGLSFAMLVVFRKAPYLFMTIGVIYFSVVLGVYGAYLILTDDPNDQSVAEGGTYCFLAGANALAFMRWKARGQFKLAARMMALASHALTENLCNQRC
jgi:hypothetical protein